MNKFALAAGVAMALAGAAPSFAQGYGPPSGPPDAYGAPPSQPTAADRARDLRDALGLRPDQEPALQAYLQAVTPSAADTARQRQDQAAAQSMTTPQRLDQMLAHYDAMRAVMVSRVAATKRFYLQLTPAQQRAFDTMRPLGQQQQRAGY